MKIMSHCNPAYFKYCEGLVKSIRYSGNEYHIILKLLDFLAQEKDYVRERLKNIDNIDLDFIDSDKEEFRITAIEKINNPNYNDFKLYTDCRPFLIYDVLEKYNEDLLAICANGLVFTNLADIEKTLKSKDFVFHERETWFGLKSIEDVDRISQPRVLEGRLRTIIGSVQIKGTVYHPMSEAVLLKRYLENNNRKLTLQQIVHLPACRVSLLGILGISNNSMAKLLNKKWKEYILQERKNDHFFSYFVGSTGPDTLENDSFNRAYINIGLSGKYSRPLTKETNLWKGNIIDNSCTSDKIWFAKGSIKTGGGKHGQGKRYLEKLEFFRSLYN
jgi:hypothetical protein